MLRQWGEEAQRTECLTLPANIEKYWEYWKKMLNMTTVNICPLPRASKQMQVSMDHLYNDLKVIIQSNKPLSNMSLTMYL